MVRLTCPSCGTVATGKEEWLRVDSVSTVAPDAPTIQLLLDDSLESSGPGLATNETTERMTTLYPCGHSFPHDTIDTVTTHLDVLGELLEQHANTTNDFEIQYLREEIQSAGAKLDVAADRCAAQLEPVSPHRHRLMRIDSNGPVDS